MRLHQQWLKDYKDYQAAHNKQTPAVVKYLYYETHSISNVP